MSILEQDVSVTETSGAHTDTDVSATETSFRF